MDLIFNHHFMDKDSNPQVLMLLDIVSKSCAENLEPFLESHLMKTELMMELMAHFQFNILVRIAAKCQVCMHHFVFKKMLDKSCEYMYYLVLEYLSWKLTWDFLLSSVCILFTLSRERVLLILIDFHCRTNRKLCIPICWNDWRNQIMNKSSQQAYKALESCIQYLVLKYSQKKTRIS